MPLSVLGYSKEQMNMNHEPNFQYGTCSCGLSVKKDSDLSVEDKLFWHLHDVEVGFFK
jgi:hypothetical protein